MAKKIADEDMVLNIIINGDKGRVELNKLERSVKDLSIANEGLAAQKLKVEKQMKKLETAGKQDTVTYKNLETEVRQLSLEMDRNQKAIGQAQQRMTLLRSGMDLTKMTISDLRSEMARLTKLRNTTTPGTDQWKAYDKQLGQVVRRYAELKDKGEATKGTLCKMADGINKYWNLVVSGLGSFAGVFLSIKGAVSKFVEFEDILSDTQKTTGLTKREVEELNETLQQIDTRTSQEELQGLARIGGKLGIEGKENLEGFVRAADQINVALKEDLGGDTEEAIRQVGKLVDIFKVKDDFGIEQGLLKVGSVINELGAASTANEGFIVEFSKRVAGVAPSAGISVDAVMGLAATLDQLGQQAEASSTVYAQMMAKMFKNTAAYANIAGMSLSEFSDLMNTDANEAFIRVLEGLKGNNEGMEALVKNLGDMQLNGVRANNILGTLSDNTAILRDQQKLANEAFREGTSLTNESNIKNNNAAALAEKQKKVRDDLIRDLGQKLQPIMVSGNDLMNTGLQILDALTGFMVKYGATLTRVTILIAAYVAGVKLQVLWKTKLKDIVNGLGDAMKKEAITQKLSTLLTNAHTAATQLSAAAVALFTGKIKAARLAFIAFSQTIKMNPMGLLLAAVTAVGIGIYKLCTHMSDAEKAQKRLQDSFKESESAALSEQRELAKLKGELDAATKGSVEYDKIRNKIIEKYGKYDANLKDELEKVGLLDETYQKLTESIRKSFGARQYEKFRQDESDNLDQVLSENLGKIQDRLLEEKGDELGTKYYSIIRDALLKGEDLSEEITAVLDEVQDKGTIMADSRMDSYVRNIQKAQKLFEETDEKAKVKFGIEIPQQNIRSLEALNFELEVAQKRLEDLERVRPDMFSEDEITRQKEYIAGLKDSIKVLDHPGTPTSGLNNKPAESAESSTPDYDAQIIALKEKYAKQLVAKKDYEKQLDQLELEQMQYRLKNFEGKEEKRVELQQKIADKQVAIREKQDKEEKTQENNKSKDYIDAILASNNTLVQKEELAFKERLRKADLNFKDKLKWTEDQNKAFEILEKQHQDNLQKIEEDAQKKAKEAQKKEKERQKKESDDYMKGITDRIKQMETAHKMEIGQKKSEYYDNLDKADSRGQRNQLTKDFGKEMTDLTAKQAEEMAGFLNDLVVEVDIDSDADLGSVILSPEQKEQVLERLNQVRENVKALKELSDYATADNYGVDILGMDAGQWEVFFGHIADGKLGIEDMQFAIQEVSAAWSTYDKLKSAQEKKELKQYEQKTKKEKAALDKQLEHGQISQEQYNAKTSQLDTDLDAKKEELDEKQAKRAKRMAIFQTIMNLATGIVKLWVDPAFPAAIPMMAVLGAIGAVQIATIAAAQYAHGKFPVIGEDDGRTYDADYVGNDLQTGIYQKPTLGLFSEKEPEMVVDGATTRKLVFDYPQIYQSIMDVSHGRAPQFADGHYQVTSTERAGEYITTSTFDPEMIELLQQILGKLENLKLEIPWYGHGGIDEKMKKANKYEKNINI